MSECEISIIQQSFMAEVEPGVRRTLGHLIRAGISRTVDSDDLLHDGILAAWQSWIAPAPACDRVSRAIKNAKWRMKYRDMSARHKRNRLRELELD